MFAAEQLRPDVQSKRVWWDIMVRGRFDLSKFVFIDDTAILTHMSRRYGRGPRGQRVVAYESLGSWKTNTLIAAIRPSGWSAAMVLKGAANADTPNFKARDIDFKAAMQSAVAGINKNAFQTTKTSPLHLDGTPANSNTSASPGEPLFRPIIQGSVDGNTVDMDVERNQFADNGIRYEASLTLINTQLKQMLAAIQGS